MPPLLLTVASQSMAPSTDPVLQQRQRTTGWLIGNFYSFILPLTQTRLERELYPVIAFIESKKQVFIEYLRSPW